MTVPPGLKTVLRLIFGLYGPRNPVLGTDLCGTVVSTGSAVTRFKPGDEVVAFTGARMGCHAEYRALAEDGVVIHRPSGLSTGEAAALFFGGSVALYLLRDRGGIRKGHKVLIIGASGSIGTAAIQLAVHFGAEATAVSSAANHPLVHSLGAARVIDYRTEDFTRNGEQYDLILDAVNAVTFSQARRSLRPGGKLLMAAAEVPGMITALMTSFSDTQAVAGVCPERLADMEYLADLAEKGVFRPVIDSEWALDQAADAHRRVDSGRKRGNVILRISEG
jgi:NADPH:quinone reductase-like Zn-dependent oxidoreductase